MTKLIKVIYKNRKLKNQKTGKEFCMTMYFLEYGDGRRVAIKPIDDYDYKALDVLASIVYDESVKEKVE